MTAIHSVATNSALIRQLSRGMGVVWRRKSAAAAPHNAAAASAVITRRASSEAGQSALSARPQSAYQGWNQ